MTLYFDMVLTNCLQKINLFVLGTRMDIAALMVEAAGLMLTGMVVVFVFLFILIGVLKVMSHFLSEPPSAQPAQAKASPKGVQGASKAHIAAISAAIEQYRKK